MYIGVFLNSSFNVNVNRTCLTRLDLSPQFSEAPQESNLDCFDRPADDIVCYPLKSVVFYSQRLSAQRWRLVKYETVMNRSRIVVDSSMTLSNGCNRILDHGKLTLDWRPCWLLQGKQSAALLFVSDGSIWSYDIGRGACTKMAKLSDYGVETRDIPDILTFAVDWSYFYWLSATKHTIQAFSFETGDTKLVDGYNFSSLPIIHQVTFPKDIVDMKLNSLAMIPVPDVSCLVPNLNISLKMTSETTASVSAFYVWNRSDECRNNLLPPLHVEVSLESHNETIEPWNKNRPLKTDTTRTQQQSFDITGLNTGK